VAGSVCEQRKHSYLAGAGLATVIIRISHLGQRGRSISGVVTATGTSWNGATGHYPGWRAEGDSAKRFN